MARLNDPESVAAAKRLAADGRVAEYIYFNVPGITYERAIQIAWQAQQEKTHAARARQGPLGNVREDAEVRVGRRREDEERSENDNSSEAEVS